MIQVQIASQITTQGVGQPRWVLVEPADPAPPGTPDEPVGVPAEPAPVPAGQWPMYLIKGTVVLAGLVLALVAARLEFGPPGLAGPGLRSVSDPAPPAPPTPVAPQPARPASAVDVVAEQRA